MNYKEIKAKHEKVCNDLINQYNVFFAFSNKQLEEGKEKIGITDNKELTSIGAGGYMPKNQFSDYLNAMDQAHKAYKKELKAAKEAKDEAIIYELNNHECFYTGDIQPVKEHFKGIYTPTEIRAVYKKQYAKEKEFNN